MYQWLCNVTVFTSLLISCYVHSGPHHIHLPPPEPSQPSHYSIPLLAYLLACYFDMITNICLGKTIHSDLFPFPKCIHPSPLQMGTGAKVNKGVKHIRVNKPCLMYRLMSKLISMPCGYEQCLLSGSIKGLLSLPTNNHL